ncbi:MAG: methyltransferase domain-containing protein [Acidimicrobiales bacterium]|nr:methyltransferase domain-containing protein [Acidimicrobiales bacterium]
MSSSEITWRDGAEERMKSIFLSTDDRSSASDFLASHITDWPSRYHLDRRRTNILRPINFDKSMRVLDVGAGTGVMSRYAAERGAEVVALEGDSMRAELASLRCEGLNVDVRCGSVNDFDDSEGFDLILVIGVLEYATNHPAGSSGFLKKLSQLLNPDGSIVIAIENQMGLAYWMGANEDHLNEPWVGLEGYVSTSSVKTFSKPVLSSLLTDAGFKHQNWLYPFPDYKLPLTILSDRAYMENDRVDLIDQLVGSPVDRSRSGVLPFFDTRALHRQVVDSDMGQDMSNSFLVICRLNESKSILDEDVIAWRFSGDRKKDFLGVRQVTVEDGTRKINRKPAYENISSESSWLIQKNDESPSEKYVSGPNLEQLALRSLREGNLKDFETLLSKFDDWLTLNTCTPPADSEIHPFLTDLSAEVLNEELLDCGFDNLVFEDGALKLIDDEWSASGGVNVDLAIARSLWKLSYLIVKSGSKVPWTSNMSIEDLTIKFLEMFPKDLRNDLLTDFYKAEASLRSVVMSGQITDHLEDLYETNRRSVNSAFSIHSTQASFRSKFSWLKRFPGGRLLARWTRPR